MLGVSQCLNDTVTRDARSTQSLAPECSSPSFFSLPPASKDDPYKMRFTLFALVASLVSIVAAQTAGVSPIPCDPPHLFVQGLTRELTSSSPSSCPPAYLDATLALLQLIPYVHPSKWLGTPERKVRI
jgi:hypothetical protein